MEKWKPIKVLCGMVPWKIMLFDERLWIMESKIGAWFAKDI